MTKKIALAMALLKGDIINISNCLKICGYSNPSREITREIEKPFNIQISRVRMKSIDQFGNPITYIDYRLNRDAEYNQEGIKLLKEFVRSNIPSITEARTEKERTIFKQQELFINTL